MVSSAVAHTPRPLPRECVLSLCFPSLAGFVRLVALPLVAFFGRFRPPRGTPPGCLLWQVSSASWYPPWLHVALRVERHKDSDDVWLGRVATVKAAMADVGKSVGGEVKQLQQVVTKLERQLESVCQAVDALSHGAVKVSTHAFG